MRLQRLLPLASALLAAPAVAQTAAPPVPCTGLPAPAAIRPYEMRLAVRAVKDGQSVRRVQSGAERERLVMLLQEVGGALQVPSRLNFAHGPMMAFTPASDSGRTKDAARKEPWMRPNVHSRIHLVLHAAGPAGGVIMTPSAFAELDTALVRALQTVGDRGGLAGLLAPGDAPGDSLEVALELVVEDTSGVTAPVARVSLPHYAGTPVRPVIGAQGGPRYPPEMREQNREGEVLLQFVVTEEGLVDLMSVQRLRVAGPPEFERAVMAWLPWGRFHPAMVGDCPVRMLVQQPFQFALQHDWLGRGASSPRRRGWP